MLSVFQFTGMLLTSISFLLCRLAFTCSFFVSVFYARKIPLLWNRKYYIDLTKYVVFCLVVSRSFQRFFSYVSRL